MTEIDRTQALEQVWLSGIIAPWYLRPSQLEIYEVLQQHKRPHVECARQFGKTTTVLVYVLEQLIQNPGWTARWCEPWKNQCHEIVIPAVNYIQRLIPDHLPKFRFKVDGTKYVHPNGSILYLRGVNEDKGEASRGPHAHIIVADEFGSWKHTRYIVDEVLKPQLETTNGPFIYASTPPKDLGHVYYHYADEAMSEGRFVQKLITDNESLSPERIEEIKKDCGGAESLAWKVERLCMRVKDDEKVIVPEFSERNEVPNDYPRPEHFDAYVGGDAGADDNTAILYAYFDFEKGEIVFEDELVLNNQTTKTIIDGSREKEQTNWGTKACQCQLAPYHIGPKMCFEHGLQPFRRVYDADKQLRIDIAQTHKYFMELPEKQDKLAAIRDFRLKVQEGKVKVKQRCQVLRRQLLVGQWKDEKHLDFQRSEEDDLKHLDALAAAIYLVRSVIWTHNPYPQNVGVSIYTNYLPESSDSQGMEGLEAAFSPLGEGIG